ncbi:MAG: IS200/IS605 family accessory protein TnpB-related protein, partial [Actinoallomurus sp.]
MADLRRIEASFVTVGPSGVAIRDRLKDLTAHDVTVLRLAGDHLGSLASRDLKARCAAGLGHDTHWWAGRKRALTGESSSRWAGSVTKATHDQWALARRSQLAHIQNLQAAIRTITHRLSLPVGEKGTKRTPGGYRSAEEWFAKTRRLHLLQDRLQRLQADHQAGRVRIVRGGKRLLRTRHNLDAAGLTKTEWRQRWQAERRFLQADGESGKRCGNETIRVTPDGQVSIKLPAPLAYLANAGHGRYVLTARVSFPHRGGQWRDRVAANRAVAYRICEDVQRGRWYLTASWTIPPVRTVPLETVRAGGVIGRRALGHPIRRQTAPPPHDQSDRAGHRTIQAAPVALGREEPRPRSPGPRTRSAPPGHAANAGNQDAQHRSERPAEHAQLMLSLRNGMWSWRGPDRSARAWPVRPRRA